MHAATYSQPKNFNINTINPNEIAMIRIVVMGASRIVPDTNNRKTSDGRNVSRDDAETTSPRTGISGGD
jgi:hypothetical protein